MITCDRSSDPHVARHAPRGEPANGVVLFAASAGGVEAMREILLALPDGLPAAFLLVQHRTPSKESMLTKVLQRSTTLHAKTAEEGEPLRTGVLYVAPPDRHLAITDRRTLHLADGTRIRHVLSSANPLFESAAAAYGPNVVAVVLTGNGSDATDGVQAVAAHGGIVIAQDPASARFASMPRSAIQTGAVRDVLPLDEIVGSVVDAIGGWKGRRAKGNV